MKKQLLKPKKNVPEGNFSVGDGQSLTFKDAQFDIILFSKSLHHHSNPTLALQETIRVLKPNGEIIIIELVPDTEYQKILKPVHNEREGIIKAGEAINVSGLKVISKQRINTPKEFADFNSLLKSLEERFEVKDSDTLKAEVEGVLGTKIQEVPLILNAEIDIYQLRA